MFKKKKKKVLKNFSLTSSRWDQLGDRKAEKRKAQDPLKRKK